jgi:MOSC domain-containing protein YiiM
MISQEIDMASPLTEDTLLEVRTGRLKTFKGLTIQSGIDKGLRTESVPISLLGLDTDEHDYTFHGGKEKAVHACKSRFSHRDV